MPKNRTSIEFSDEHLQVIMRALEAYERFKMGQVDYALEMLTDMNIDYEDRQELSELVRKKMFPDLMPNQSYGIGNKEVGDAQIAYEIQKVIDNYLSVKRSKGYWGNTVNFNEPLKYSKIPLPVVKKFKQYKDFEIDEKYWVELYKHVHDNQNYPETWKLVDKWKSETDNKELKSITGSEKSEIVCKNSYPMGKEFHPVVKWYYRVHKPRKD